MPVLSLFFVFVILVVRSRALRKTRTQHTYDDARLMMKGMELGLPEDACLLEYAAAKDMTGWVVAQLHPTLLTHFGNAPTIWCHILSPEMKDLVCLSSYMYVRLFEKDTQFCSTLMLRSHTVWLSMCRGVFCIFVPAALVFMTLWSYCIGLLNLIVTRTDT